MIDLYHQIPVTYNTLYRHFVRAVSEFRTIVNSIERLKHSDLENQFQGCRACPNVKWH